MAMVLGVGLAHVLGLLAMNPQLADFVTETQKRCEGDLPLWRPVLFPDLTDSDWLDT